MSIGADMGVLAATGDELLEQWRDLGPTLWLVTGVLAALWLGTLGLLAAWHDPRRVRPGAAMLELQGPEPPAVVNLLVTDWDLGHEAVPATLIDLAAKRFVDIDMVGDSTYVSARRRGTADPARLTRYESMVLGHIWDLAERTEDGRIPAEALTTGPEHSAKRWWKRFHSSVIDDARDRGLSRPRWPATVKTVMILLALPVAFVAALAASTLPDDPDDPDDDPLGGAIACGIGSLVGATALVASRSGERDTPAGREAAAKWLGLRELLAEDPLFAEQPPASVAIWDHLLAHGTALGVAHGVVQSLPLGAESEREAWSSVGGRWRVVRVRYPRTIPPMYGYHPALVLFCGLLIAFIGLPMLGYLIPAFGDLLEAVREGSTTDFGTELPRGLATPLAIIGPLVAIALGLVSVVGGWMILVGFSDLVTGRTTVEGKVLRIRERAKQDNNKVVCHVAVDDGTTNKIRAWRFRRYTVAYRGATVRGRATRFLRHVRDLEVVGAAATPAEASATATAPQPAGQAAGVPALPFGLGSRQGTSLAAAAMAAVEALTAAAGQGRTGPAAGGPPPGTPGTPPGPGGPGTPHGPAPDGAAGSMAGPAPLPPTPALPDDAAISAVTGMPFARDAGAKPHPAGLAGGSALYRAGGKAHVQVVWVPPVTIDVYRRLPAALRHEIPGLGDEGYRARFGGGVMARRGQYVVMVTPHLPGVDGAQRDDIAARVAAAALAVAPAGPPPSGPPPGHGGPPPVPAGPPPGPATQPPAIAGSPVPTGSTAPAQPAHAPGTLPPPPPPPGATPGAPGR
jgi:hypothetical protein